MRRSGPGSLSGSQPLRASWDPIRGGGGRPRSAQRPSRVGVRRRSTIGRFVSAYGWRAYAIPVLVVVTVLAIFGAPRPSSAEQPPATAGAPTVGGLDDNPALGSLSTGAPRSSVVVAPPAGDGSFDVSIPAGALPDGGPIPDASAKAWHVLRGTTPQVGSGAQPISTYTVEVQDGMDTSSFGGEESFARMVDSTLDNPKSWTHDPQFTFRRIDSGEPSFRISLSDRMTVRDVCGYSIRLEVSCNDRSTGRVVINVARWVRGAIDFQGDIGTYRQYAINHEVGHAIGFGHQACGSDGELAPVMMQQTFSTSNDKIAALSPGGVVQADGAKCRINGWPFPRG